MQRSVAEIASVMEFVAVFSTRDAAKTGGDVFSKPPSGHTIVHQQIINQS